MIGRTLGHYRIEERLGAGGMGEVWRARDTRLDRDVAIKVLSSGTLPGDAARARWLHEARAASALNHPNICTVHDVGEADSQLFIAFELVQGRPLSQLIPAEGLPAETATRYGMQIADALAHAHQRGVVHRDLKTANIVVTPEGRVKVLDFGLARRIASIGLDAVTRSQESLGAVEGLAGTLAYMAPEQLRGEPGSAPGDIWALGVVLYEMAAGRLPFSGRTGFELSSSILQHSAPPLPAHVPAGLRAVIQRCLVKEPGERYASAGEVRAALEAIASHAGVTAPAAGRARGWKRILRLDVGIAVLAAALLLLLYGLGVLAPRRGITTVPAIQSLAVLPLANLSGDPAQEYFADGMTEALITELAQISSLKVIARTSVMQYRSAPKPLPEIARELGVEGVVEGSVQRSAERVGISVKLVEAPGGRTLWARSYERELRDVFALQREVAGAIAREIRVQVTPEERARLEEARTVDPAAHEAYLLGRHHTEKRTPESLETAVGYFHQAIALDPRFARAHAGLALAHLARDIWGGTGLGQSAIQARSAARRALELDPSLAEGHLALAETLFVHDWDWPAAEAAFHRSLELNPNFHDAYHRYAFFLQAMGRHDEALAAIRRAVSLAPTAVTFVDSEGRILYRARRYEEALASFRRALELDPSYRPTFGRMADAYAAMGRYADALAALEQGQRELGLERMPGVAGMVRRGYVYARMGRRREALEVARELERADQASGGLANLNELASIYAALGDLDRALDLLEEGVERRALLPFFSVDPKFDPLRSHPRWKALVTRIQLPG